MERGAVQDLLDVHSFIGQPRAGVVFIDDTNCNAGICHPVNRALARTIKGGLYKSLVRVFKSPREWADAV